MDELEITYIQTHARYQGEGQPARQWADVGLRIPKGFDWKANGAAVLKKLQAAADLIGSGE